MNRGQAGRLGSALRGDAIPGSLVVFRVRFAAGEAPALGERRDTGGAGTRERIDHQIARARVLCDQLPKERERFLGGMEPAPVLADRLEIYAVVIRAVEGSTGALHGAHGHLARIREIGDLAVERHRIGLDPVDHPQLAEPRRGEHLREGFELPEVKKHDGRAARPQHARHLGDGVGEMADAEFGLGVPGAEMHADAEAGLTILDAGEPGLARDQVGWIGQHEIDAGARQARQKGQRGLLSEVNGEARVGGKARGGRGEGHWWLRMFWSRENLTDAKRPETGSGPDLRVGPEITQGI